MIEGIDVSQFQGPIDWQKVAADGKAFAICRATIGLGTDPTFLTNCRGARAAGLLVGAYHAYETSRDPIEQAKHFGAVAAGCIDIFPALDFEGGCAGIPAAQALRMARTFCETGDTIFVKTMGVYSFPFFWNGLVWKATADDAAWCRDRPFWLALYPGKDNPDPLAPFSSVDLHQYSAKGVVPGIHGPVDLDRYYGTLDELRLVGVYEPTDTLAPVS